MPYDVPWTDPPTFGVGQTPTSDQWQDVADDLTYLHAPPRCRVYRSSTQSIPNDTETTVSFNTERWDKPSPGGMWEADEPTKIVFVDPGWYELGALVMFGSSATGYRQASIVHSAGAVLARSQLVPGTATQTVLNPVGEWELGAADWITLVVRHTAGAALNIGPSTASLAYGAEMWATWMGGA